MDNRKDEILTLPEAAAFLQIRPQTLYKKTSRREIPHFQTGRKLYFIESELRAWILAHRVPTVEQVETLAANHSL